MDSSYGELCLASVPDKLIDAEWAWSRPAVAEKEHPCVKQTSVNGASGVWLFRRGPEVWHLAGYVRVRWQSLERLVFIMLKWSLSKVWTSAGSCTVAWRSGVVWPCRRLLFLLIERRSASAIQANGQVVWHGLPSRIGFTLVDLVLCDGNMEVFVCCAGIEMGEMGVDSTLCPRDKFVAIRSSKRTARRVGSDGSILSSSL